MTFQVNRDEPGKHMLNTLIVLNDYMLFAQGCGQWVYILKDYFKRASFLNELASVFLILWCCFLGF